jgi:predicted HTH domain antitoxin
MAQTILKIEFPDSALLRTLKVPKDQLSEFLRHTIAVELYREGKVSLGKAKEFAGLGNKWEMIQLLNERGVDLNYSAEDAMADLETLDRLLP